MKVLTANTFLRDAVRESVSPSVGPSGCRLEGSAFDLSLLGATYSPVSSLIPIYEDEFEKKAVYKG